MTVEPRSRKRARLATTVIVAPLVAALAIVLIDLIVRLLQHREIADPNLGLAGTAAINTYVYTIALAIPVYLTVLLLGLPILFLMSQRFLTPWTFLILGLLGGGLVAPLLANAIMAITLWLRGIDNAMHLWPNLGSLENIGQAVAGMLVAWTIGKFGRLQTGKPD